MKQHLPGIKLILVTIAAVVSIIFLTFLYSITFNQTNATLSTSRKIIHINNIQIELEKTIARLLYAETVQKNFLLTNDSAYLNSFSHVKMELATSFSLLFQYLANDGHQLKQLDLLEKTIGLRIDLLESTFSAPIYNQNESEKLAMNLKYGAELMEKSRDITKKMVNYQEEHLKLLEKEHRQAITLMPITYFILVLVLLVIFSFLFIKLNTNRKKLIKINDELKIINQTYAQAEKLAGLGNWRYSFQDKSSIYSQNFYSILGLDPKQHKLNLRHFLKLIHPDDRSNVIESFKNSVRHYKPFIVSYRIYTKDYKIKYIKSIGKIIKDNKNQKYFNGINMDITEMVTNSKQLEIKNKKLELFNTDLASFNYVASHDLQAPLRKIQMFISRINEMELPNMSKQGIEYFKRINTAAAHMQVLINDLLLFSRTNTSTAEFELTNLNELLSNAKEELNLQIEEKNAQIVCESLPTIFAIPYQLQQLFINLLSNSIKFAREEEPPIIKISHHIIQKQFVLFDEDLISDTYHKITVCDNGIGFENHYAEKIFHLLFRLHDKAEYPGSGIGLAICKKIIENHFGFIEATSEPGRGTCFNIYIPTNLR